MSDTLMTIARLVAPPQHTSDMKATKTPGRIRIAGEVLLLFSASYFDEWYRRIRQARPFLRWAGGKQPFLMRFPSVIPDFSGKYIEPFLGSGSVFFHVQRRNVRPCPSMLGDINLQLVETYLEVRENPERVHEALVALDAGYRASSDRARFYYEIRDSFNHRLPRVDPAVFIFLNRTGWNGLYRVNQNGEYNVPHGQLKSDRKIIPSLEDLRNAAAALSQCQLRATSWENTLAFAQRGDFVFVDPPYYSDVESESTKYRKQQFTLKHHERLASRLQALAKRGADFVLTNSGEYQMIELYQRAGFSVTSIKVPRFISSKIYNRVAVSEIIVRPAGRAPLELNLTFDNPRTNQVADDFPVD